MDSELDMFLNNCVEGKITGDAHLSHTKEVVSELKRRIAAKPGYDPRDVTIRYLLERAIADDLRLMAVERALGDLGAIASAASNR